MRKISLIIIIILVALAGVATCLIFGTTVNNPDKKFLYIPTGADIARVRDSLKDNKFLSGVFVFDKISAWAELPQNIRPGKYKVEDGMSVYRLVRKLRSGQQETVNLTITKVRTKGELAKRISGNFELDSVAVMNFLNSNDSLLRFDVDTNTVFTGIIPDTYTYFWTAPMDVIFRKLFKEKEKFWTGGRKKKAAAHGLTPAEVYILASIVEEETNKQDDKGKIASVYLNRIRKGMPLSADPTIKFAMNDFTLTRIYHKYLEIVSPFNTYRNKGLPPGPICTPSRKTLLAVLDAPETNYLFFVAKPDFSGYSNFAATYKEHLIFARAYQQALDSLERKKLEKEMQ